MSLNLSINASQLSLTYSTPKANAAIAAAMAINLILKVVTIPTILPNTTSNGPKAPVKIPKVTIIFFTSGSSLAKPSKKDLN